LELLESAVQRACQRVFEDAMKNPDRKLSRVHALLGSDGRDLWLEDGGSKNGVRVNGSRLHRRRPLDPGDVVELGAQTLEVKMAADLLRAGGHLAAGPRPGVDLPALVVGVVGALASGTVLVWILLG